jgi:hypothetical protein
MGRRRVSSPTPQSGGGSARARTLRLTTAHWCPSLFSSLCRVPRARCGHGPPAGLVTHSSIRGRKRTGLDLAPDNCPLVPLPIFIAVPCSEGKVWPWAAGGSRHPLLNPDDGSLQGPCCIEEWVCSRLGPHSLAHPLLVPASHSFRSGSAQLNVAVHIRQLATF